MYQVPPSNQRGDGKQLTSPEERCPRCGSRRQIPGDSGWGLRQIPRSMQTIVCAECGTRYRVAPPLPTWADLGNDLLFYLGMFVMLVLAALLLL